jgi:hypothetical protein
MKIVKILPFREIDRFSNFENRFLEIVGFCIQYKIVNPIIITFLYPFSLILI